MTDTGAGCERCGHFWHGLMCKKENYDNHMYLVFVCNCPPCWPASDLETDVEPT